MFGWVYLQYAVNVCARPRVISPGWQIVSPLLHKSSFFLRGDESLSIRNSQWSNATEYTYSSAVFKHSFYILTIICYFILLLHHLSEGNIYIYITVLVTGYFV